MLCELFSFEYTVWGYVMVELTMMLFKKGPENNIRCRTINGWFKTDSYVSSTEKLLLEIERLGPNIVVIDLDLFDHIGGIETMHTLRNRFDINVWYE